MSTLGDLARTEARIRGWDGVVDDLREISEDVVAERERLLGPDRGH